MESATALRAKEAAAFEKESSELTANIAAVEKATVAIEKGMGGAFLQTAAANILRRLAQKTEDGAELVSFLSGEQSQDYAPQSGQITGILKTMHDEMTASLTEATATENTAIANFNELMAAKKKEVLALQASIEAK